MPVLMHPWWLITLGIIPIIRWLHCRDAPLYLHAVSAVFLWPTQASEIDAGSKRSPPDPAWQRRALIASLLIIALAAPEVDLEQEKVVVWIDDSLSMQAIENGETRMATAERALELALADYASTNITRHFLADTLPASLDGQTANWLVTDGASERIRVWAGQFSLDRVIQTGTATNNSGITRLSLRRSLIDSEVFQVLVSVSNTGNDTDERSVQLLLGGQLHDAATVIIEPGQLAHWRTSIPADTDAIIATLNAGDVLEDDDHLNITETALRPLRVLIGEDCSHNLRLALDAHPALDTRSGEPGDLLVTCSQEMLSDVDSRAGSHSGARIHVVQGPAVHVTSMPVWLPSDRMSGTLQLPVDKLRAATWPRAPDDEQTVLLQSDGSPLILVSGSQDAKTSIIETVIDLQHSGFAKQPEYAALVATLVDAAVGTTTLDAVVSQKRDVADTVIRPTRISINPDRQGTTQNNAAVPLSGAFLLLSLFIIALDILLLLRIRRRADHA